MNKVKCLRCNGIWNARVVNPKVCAFCKSKKWQLPKSPRADILVKFLINLETSK